MKLVVDLAVETREERAVYECFCPLLFLASVSKKVEDWLYAVCLAFLRLPISDFYSSPEIMAGLKAGSMMLFEVVIGLSPLTGFFFKKGFLLRMSAMSGFPALDNADDELAADLEKS